MLARWAAEGVGYIRDAGSPNGATLDLDLPAGLPHVQAAGRFLAPPNKYFPALLPDPAPPEELTRLALGELHRGSSWVKVIADFPELTDGTPAGPSSPTYATEVLADLVTAVHAAGGRVAAHCVTTLVAALVDIGVDSIEHGVAMDADALAAMATTGAAWTPTLNPMVALPDDAPIHARQSVDAYRERLRELLPLAVRLGVPILAGTDGFGTLPGEIALLAEHGLDPIDALRAGTTSAYQFLGKDADGSGRGITLATYEADPREDLAVLAAPVAVVVGGVRVR
jgi:imidazolonepropionase-like amidohydrolase